MIINDFERLDDLQIKLPNGKNAYVIQNPNWFCFGTDAVLLANFSKIKPNSEVIDLCTGSGIIPVILSAKTKAKKIIGIEIQEKVADMAKRTVSYNELEDIIEIINCDLNEYKKEKQVQTVICNPPYKQDNGGIKSLDEVEKISRHEIFCTIDDVIKRASKLLLFGGSFNLIHRPERLTEIFVTLRKYDLEPKRMQLVYPKINKSPTMVLIEAKRGSKEGLIVEKPLIMYDESGKYSDEVLKIYDLI